MSVTPQPAVEPSVAAQEAFASYVVDAVISDASGLTDGDRCVGEPPSARYFLGSLAPEDLDRSASAGRRFRETANAAGYDFEMASADGSVEVFADLSIYYRVFPTLEEQLQTHPLDPQALNGEYPLVPVFSRAEIPSVSVLIPLDSLNSDSVQNYAEEEFNRAFTIATDTLTANPALYRRADPRRGHRPRVPASELRDRDPSKFEAWCATLPGQPVIPDWSATFSVRRRTTASGHTRISLRLVNRSKDPVITLQQSRGLVQQHDDDRDHFIFRTSLIVRPRRGRIIPIAMDLGPDAYRYNPNLGAYAYNCGIEWSSDPSGNIAEISSTFAPKSDTCRIESREHHATSFETLADDPLPALDELASNLAAYAQDPAWSTAELSAEQASVKSRDLDAFKAEVARFRTGIYWLRRDCRLQLAFRLTNRTMIKLGTMTHREYKAWYLFQLIFIVSQLSSLAWREHPPAEFESPHAGGEQDPTSVASVLWYPTGGGKTEAYLGLSICAMFYDRARGKGEGVTVWCRLPLRLLTLQATQRQVTFVAAAEEIRQEAMNEILNVGGVVGAPFRVGLYMGESNTPNTMSRDADAVRALASDASARSRFCIVDECPYCRKRHVEIEPPDVNALRLIHRCMACHMEIPILVTDAEIYRYLPSFVVGTVDKLAIMGLTDKFGALLGDVDGRCTLHGFGRGGKCFERRAEGHPRNTWQPLPSTLYDASPSLEIIDELHMLREELGAFDGHYESGMATIQRQLSPRGRSDQRGVRMKVIATTATIKGEDRQCDHLFGLSSTVFPLPGPTLNDSFYWLPRPDLPLRRFVGLLPQRTTAEQALVRVLIAFHRAIRILDDVGSSAHSRLAAMDAWEFETLRDRYRVSLTYVTSLRDFGKISRSMQTQVNQNLRRDGIRELKVEHLSAESARNGGIGNVRRIIDNLEQRGGDIDAVLSTSMIAHGVDIPRLNVMFFHGMPKSMAEYIQASSRIGRRDFGIVFMLFNPVRERDRSHHRYHAKFHEYLDRMVEPVAINRWSRYAARKTLPGILMGEILQSVNRAWWQDGHAPQHLHELGQMQAALRPVSAGGIAAAQPPALLESIRKSFLADRDEALELTEELSDFVEIATATIRSAGAGGTVRGPGRSQYRATGDHLGLSYDPMLSLRDVEENVQIFVLDRRAR